MIPKFRAWDKFDKVMRDVTLLDYNQDFVGYSYPVFMKSTMHMELMQSTGLKDKNGKEIFEGDILANGPDVMCMKRHNTLGFYVEKKGGVEFIADGAVLEEFEEDAKEIADSLEIIGNVYENKEFLEVINEKRK
ncbi:YopX family protein [Streptococcus infantis]|uniref:YopX family protein n=1 Tax=Streptococcus infantis TaxID=68892 RepID=UPI0039C06657